MAKNESKESKDVKIMSVTFKKHEYSKGMLIFRSENDVQMHRQPNPTKDTFISLGNGEFGKVHSFHILTEDGLSNVESYMITDLAAVIKSKFGNP